MRAKLVWFDDYWLDYTSGVQRRHFSPSLISIYEDPIFRNGVYPSIHWCPEVNKYRIWYEVLPDIKNDALRYLALAESEDAFTWKPYTPDADSTLELQDFPHIVYTGNGGLHGTSVFRDSNAKDSSAFYKAAGMTRTYQGDERPETLPVRLSVSPDGIHWKEGKVIYPYTSDALNALFYNPCSEEYMLLHRAAYVDRRVFTSTSKNLHDWSNPKLTVHPDTRFGEQSVQLYSMWGGWDDGIFIGFIMKYYVDKGEDNYSTMNGFLDSDLMYSYDGFTWMHGGCSPLIERMKPGEFGHANLVITGMTSSKDETRSIIIAEGTQFAHANSEVYEEQIKKYQTAAHQLMIYDIRKDGFVGLENCSGVGMISTKPVELLEDNVTINISVPFGEARCALLDPEGKPYTGFSFDESIPFTGDSVAWKPTWKDKKPSSLIGSRLRIAVRYFSGILYAVQASMRPSIRTSQESFWNPVQIKPERPKNTD